MSDRVEAESGEAKRFLTALRGVLAVPKAELDKKIARSRKKNKAKRKSAKSQ